LVHVAQKFSIVQSKGTGTTISKDVSYTRSKNWGEGKGHGMAGAGKVVQ
jgi:hypothetical protein